MSFESHFSMWDNISLTFHAWWSGFPVNLPTGNTIFHLPKQVQFLSIQYMTAFFIPLRTKSLNVYWMNLECFGCSWDVHIIQHKNIVRTWQIFAIWCPQKNHNEFWCIIAKKTQQCFLINLMVQSSICSKSQSACGNKFLINLNLLRGSCLTVVQTRW